jgi:hypothetical protein
MAKVVLAKNNHLENCIGPKKNYQEWSNVTL